jgi:hypothetical protein
MRLHDSSIALNSMQHTLNPNWFPMPYDISRKPYGCYKRLHGHVTTGESLQSIFESHASQICNQTRHNINDLLDVEAHSVSMQKVKIVSKKCKWGDNYITNRKVAMVTTNGLTNDRYARGDAGKCCNWRHSGPTRGSFLGELRMRLVACLRAVPPAHLTEPNAQVFVVATDMLPGRHQGLHRSRA